MIKSQIDISFEMLLSSKYTEAIQDMSLLVVFKPEASETKRKTDVN